MAFPDIGDEWDKLCREMDALGFLHCDTCGNWYPPFEFAETIEEMLCERCASGVEGEEDFCDGQEYGYDEEMWERGYD